MQIGNYKNVTIEDDYMAMWAFSKAPMILDSDISSLSVTSPSLAVLKLTTLIDINQNADS